MQMIVLANSYKYGGRCVAGFNITGHKWVRPISMQTHGELSISQCEVNVNGVQRSVRCLDFIEIPVGSSTPQVAQPENHELLSGKWKWLKSLDRKQAVDLLELLHDSSKELLFNTESKVNHNEADGGQVSKSLTVIKVANPKFFLGLKQGKSAQLRTEFSYSGVIYDLPITDDGPWTKYAREEPERFSKGTWYFTISLGELWNGSMWKLVAGAMSKDLLIEGNFDLGQKIDEASKWWNGGQS